jgi:hypothetical protein
VVRFGVIESRKKKCLSIVDVVAVFFST